ncbi:hypothetical protein PPL_07469 [Heterostelium album PN500]|uniref:Uncharacterized protein n=1 Tax=Heterostelium pallidum (strain ATCC 26659 / Pp 5 / PN500) TaxID=670386 RepID=D3BG18_HETP5|nr:hypothetical protein PPL_07469 [Heterostelium album PN500]EFA79610.1 hypothetical protein PPL_07469 [Heterostelium album PN500]|eukprot:XP_020431731.1 hypothetical protein PPL_07469 [Heterostelium album PN500]
MARKAMIWAIDIWSLLRDYSSNIEVGDVKFKLEPPGSKIVGHDEHMMPVFSPKALKDLGGEVNVRTSTHGLPANLQTNLPNVTYNDDCTDTIPHEKQCSSNQVLEIYTSDKRAAIMFTGPDIHHDRSTITITTTTHLPSNRVKDANQIITLQPLTYNTLRHELLKFNN